MKSIHKPNQNRKGDPLENFKTPAHMHALDLKKQKLLSVEVLLNFSRLELGVGTFRVEVSSPQWPLYY